MKKLTRQFWHIECTESVKTHYMDVIPVSHMKESALKSLLSFLICKYALTNEEVAEQYTKVSFKKKKE